MGKNHIEVWNNCLKVIRDNVKPISFKTWFEPIIPLKLEHNVLTIQVPSSFFYEYIEEKYIDLLSKILRKEIGEDAKLEYNIVMDNNISSSKPYAIKLPAKNIKDLSKQDVPIPISTEEKNIKNPFILPGIKKLNIDPQLNPDYSFENFIEGDCNRLARSAGFAVACNPGGTAFNPLFIYSANGLGKSHLSQAIGVEVKKRFPDKIVLYVQAHKFVTQFMEAIRSNNSNDFVHFYQMIDVLIIDDVHDFAGKEKTQDIFFHIFNHLHQLNRQLIITADKAPVELQGFEHRLLSRFKWGLAADLQVPDFETRLAILKRKTYNDGIEMLEEVLEHIASHMEGALISILAQSTLNKKEITIDLAKQIIDKIVKGTRREVSIDYIQKIVCDYFNISVDSLKSKTRKREIVQARQVAMYFAKAFTKNSLAVIGSIIGGKDHATVLHACRTVQNLMETDKKFKQYVDDIEKKLKM